MKGKLWLIVLAMGLMVVLQACGGGSTLGGKASISISPTSANLQPGETKQFKATVTGTSNTAVTWKTSSGKVGGSGNTITYTASKDSGDYTLTATSKADANASAVANIHVLSSTQTTVTMPVTTIPGSKPQDLVALSPLAEAPLGTTSSKATFTVSKDRVSSIAVIDTKRHFG